MIPEPNADDLERRAVVAERALMKINEIRNSIIGLQTVNWSEHIYPLVCALNKAGIQGMEYPEAQSKYRTMLERLVAAERERDEYKRWRDAIDDALVCCEIVTSDDPSESINRLICWHNQVALDPRVSAEAASLRDTFKAERDELRAELDLECSKCLFILSSGITQDGCCGCTIAKLRVEVERLRAFCIGLRKSIEGGGRWTGDLVGGLHLDLVEAIEGPK